MSDLGRVLVTGASSGFGKHCYEVFNGIAFSRQVDFSHVLNQAKEQPFDLIIHSAFNVKSNIVFSQLHSYLHDTILLTKKLATLPHRKFIFISSTDVYPKNLAKHQEGDDIELRDVGELYGISKLMSESIVRTETNNYLILRPTALLGRHSRPNSLIKILMQDNPSLSLSAESVFNYVRHTDLSDFIKVAVNKDLTGIYNISAASSIELGSVAHHFKRAVQFGGYTYLTGDISNTKASMLLPSLNNTSLENIGLFLKEMKMELAVNA